MQIATVKAEATTRTGIQHTHMQTHTLMHTLVYAHAHLNSTINLATLLRCCTTA